MTSSTNYMQELSVINCYSAHNFDSDSIYEECPPLLEAISYLCMVSDSHNPYEEDVLCSYSISPPYEKGEVYLAAGSHGRDQLPYNSWRNWDRAYDCCFNLSGYYDDNFSSYEDGNGPEKAECWPQSDEHEVGYDSHLDDAENHLSFYDTALSATESWFGLVGEEDSNYYGGQNLTYACSYNYNYKPDELGLFEGIFGYWPCLHQQHPQPHVE